MTRAMGEPHSAAQVHARSGARPDDHHSIETLVDAELEKLNAIVGPPPALEREPEVLGGCSCGAVFFTYEGADEHDDYCRLVPRGPFGGDA